MLSQKKRKGVNHLAGVPPNPLVLLGLLGTKLYAVTTDQSRPALLPNTGAVP
jgi:hypothetical protein